MMRLRTPLPPRCGVCDSAEVGTDEVVERGLWLLSECRRCRHRWTEGPFGPSGPAAVRARSGAEVAAA